MVLFLVEVLTKTLWLMPLMFTAYILLKENVVSVMFSSIDLRSCFVRQIFWFENLYAQYPVHFGAFKLIKNVDLSEII